jgi:uncharacterized protein (TIGR01244 family)
MRHTLLLCSILTAAAASAGVPETMDPGQIPYYKLLTPGIATAGQPSSQALPKLAALGFKTVINLRMPGEDAPPDERAVVEGQGLRYVHVPLTAASLSAADVAAVEKVLDDPAAAPVLFHCTTSNRVGAVWALVQVRKGRSLDDALAAGREAGLRSPVLEEAVRKLATPAPKAP